MIFLNNHCDIQNHAYLFVFHNGVAHRDHNKMEKERIHDIFYQK